MYKVEAHPHAVAGITVGARVQFEYRGHTITGTVAYRFSDTIAVALDPECLALTHTPPNHEVLLDLGNPSLCLLTKGMMMG